MMFWTLAIQRSLKQALTGSGATSQLLCPCLNTRGGESQFTSSSEVMNCCQVNKTKTQIVAVFPNDYYKFFVAFCYCPFRVKHVDFY